MKREYLTTEQGKMLIREMRLKAFLLFTIQELNDYMIQYGISDTGNAASMLIQSECQNNEKLASSLKIDPFLDQIVATEADGSSYEEGLIFFNVVADVGKKKPRKLGKVVAIDYYNTVDLIVENEMLQEDQALTVDEVERPIPVSEPVIEVVESEILEPEIDLAESSQPEFVEEIVEQQPEQETSEAIDSGQQESIMQDEETILDAGQEDEELARQQAELEAARIQQEEELARQQAELEAARIQQEEELARQQAEQAAMQQQAHEQMLAEQQQMMINQQQAHEKMMAEQLAHQKEMLAQQQLMQQQELERQQQMLKQQEIEHQKKLMEQQQMLQQHELERQMRKMEEQQRLQQLEFERQQQLLQEQMQQYSAIEIPKNIYYNEIYGDEVASEEFDKNLEYYEGQNEFLNKVYYAKSHGFEGKREYDFYQKDKVPSEFEKVDYIKEYDELGLPSGPSNILIENLESIGNIGYIPYPYGPLKRPPVPYDL